MLGPVRNDISSAWDLSSHDIAICNYLFEDNLSIVSTSGYDFLKKKINDISFISAKIKDIKIDLKASWLNPEKNKKNNYSWKKKECYCLMNLIIKILLRFIINMQYPKN